MRELFFLRFAAVQNVGAMDGSLANYIGSLGRAKAGSYDSSSSYESYNRLGLTLSLAAGATNADAVPGSPSSAGLSTKSHDPYRWVLHQFGSKSAPPNGTAFSSFGLRSRWSWWNITTFFKTDSRARPASRCVLRPNRLRLPSLPRPSTGRSLTFHRLLTSNVTYRHLLTTSLS